MNKNMLNILKSKKLGIVFSLVVLGCCILTLASLSAVGMPYFDPLFGAGLGGYGGLLGGGLLGYTNPLYYTNFTASLAALGEPITIPSYGYPYSPYVTPFPYLTTTGAASLCVTFSYPYYTYGDPSFYIMPIVWS